jgi:trehalose 6-phosphate synthase
VWVHDFHLFPLGAELRRRGARHRIGFFLHVPFPPRALWSVLPRSGELLADLAAYDVIGLQTEEDAENLRDALVHAGHPDAASRVAAFAIGIDAAGFIAAAEKSARAPETARLMDSLGGRHLLIGVDRLDYTKGLPQRFAGYAQLLARFPRHRGKVTYLQVAPVSRGDVAQYRALRRELDEWAGRINGQHAEFDWAPLRYLTRAVPRSTLAGFMRRARVGVVTPLRDGMNLVAKEYVAAQDPEDPGTLVLSRFAGAAQELDGALLVNPMDPDEIAEALDAALVMPLDERVDGGARLWVGLQRSTAAAWCRHFLAALESAEPRASTAVAAAPAAAALRTRPWRRSAGYARG